MIIWFDLYHGEEEGLEEKKKKIVFGKKPQRPIDFFPLA